MQLAEIPDVDVPVSFDWRKHGVVTPVKNQVRFQCYLFSQTFFHLRWTGEIYMAALILFYVLSYSAGRLDGGFLSGQPLPDSSAS